MKPFAPLALATLLAATALAPSSPLSAQATFTDPANLRGERPTAITGRELPQDQGILGLQQVLRRLNTRASLLLIVAHPDDEDGGMLTLYSRGLGARVGILTLNRGEGGQNAMTADFEDALGLLRTQELLSADRYLGVDQMFGTEVDFGFSKLKEEAFAKWTHERVLYDAVRAVRLYRPMVIASVFIGGVTDGHGQHQVSGQIAQEVFNAAGDPKVFPELTAEGILPWQPLKVYARVPMQSISPQGLFDYATNQYLPAEFKNYVTGEVTTTVPTSDVIVHEGDQDPLFGPALAKESFLSYKQFARTGLGLQRSQVGPNVRTAAPGVADSAYHRYGSRLKFQNPTEPNFFDGIDTSLKGIASFGPADPAFLLTGLARIQSSVESAVQHLNADDPTTIAPQLSQGLRDTTELISQLEKAELPEAEKSEALHELRIKRTQFNQALALSLGLTFDATTTGANQVAGTAVQVWTQLRSRASTELVVEKVWLTTALGDVPSLAVSRDEKPEFDRYLTPDRPSQRALVATAQYTSTITRPYFYRDSLEEAVYKLKVAALRLAPQTPPALTASAVVTYKGVPIELTRVVHNDDFASQPVSFIPPASLTLSSHAQILPSVESSLLVTSSLLPVEKPPVTPKITVPMGWKSHLGISDVLAPGQSLFDITAPATKRSDITAKASATLANHDTITEGFRTVGYSGLIGTNFYTPSTLRVVPTELKLTGHRRVAYLPGTGDSVPAALASIGLPVEALTIADLNATTLAKYDTVILGVRTYNAHPDLHGAPTKALLDFVRAGGNVVVQFQTAEFTAADAPYPLVLGYDAEKIIDETDPVTLLEPNHPLLTTPNKITPADFDGWINERGHGILKSWDARYTALLEAHDPGSKAEHVAPQEPQKGGIITTQLGKGHWTYCAFALYRQLPEAVPGAFRLFLNLLNP